MKKLKTLAAAIALVLMLGQGAFAGETSTPPCAPPEGGQSSPPACGESLGHPPASGDTQAATIGSAVDEVSFTELAVGMLESILPLL